MTDNNAEATCCKESYGFEGAKKHSVAKRNTFEFNMGRALCDPKMGNKVMEMFALGQRLTVGVENGHNHY